METRITKIIFDYTLILFLFLNYLGVYQPLTGNICKCVPVYLSFGILISLIGIILMFIIFCFGTKEQTLESVKTLRKNNKFYNIVTSIIIVIAFIINGFVGNLILFIILKSLLFILSTEVEVIKENIEKIFLINVLTNSNDSNIMYTERRKDAERW